MRGLRWVVLCTVTLASVLSAIPGGANVNVMVAVNRECSLGSVRVSKSATPLALPELERLVGELEAYGEEFPNEYLGAGIVWTQRNQDPSQWRGFAAAALVRNLGSHAKRFADRVPNARAVAFCRGRANRSRTKEIATEIEKSDPWASRSFALTGLTVGLRGNRVVDARRLHRIYGDAIALQVGNLSFPGKRRLNVELCGRRVRPHLSSGSVRWTITPHSVSVGHDVATSVRITNTGPGPRKYRGDTLGVGVITLTNSKTVIGASGIGRDQLVAGELAPGQSAELEVLAGVDSCDPTLGWVLPKGRYEIRYAVTFVEGTSATVEWSPPIPLRID
jgi:hypothetical protein